MLATIVPAPTLTKISKSLNCVTEDRCVQSQSQCLPGAGRLGENGVLRYSYDFQVLFKEKVICKTPAGKKITTSKVVTEKIQLRFRFPCINV